MVHPGTFEQENGNMNRAPCPTCGSPHGIVMMFGVADCESCYAKKRATAHGAELGLVPRQVKSSPKEPATANSGFESGDVWRHVGSSFLWEQSSNPSIAYLVGHPLETRRVDDSLERELVRPARWRVGDILRASRTGRRFTVNHVTDKGVATVVSPAGNELPIGPPERVPGLILIHREGVRVAEVPHAG